MVMDWW